MAYATMTRGRQIPPPVQMALRRMPPGTQYLGEDRYYYHFVRPGGSPYQLDGIGDMFTRMFKFTPKSFTPGNIYKGFINTTLTVASGGLYQALPKNLKKTVYEVGKVAIPVVAGGVLAFTAGPAVMGVLGPKLAAAGSLLGKAASSVGGAALSMMGKMSQAGAANVATNITPEQLAQWDSTGLIPPSLEPLLANALQQSVPAQGGAASLYDPGAMALAEMQRQQREQDAGGLDWSTLLMIGLPVVAVGAVMMTRK